MVQTAERTANTQQVRQLIQHSMAHRIDREPIKMRIVGAAMECLASASEEDLTIDRIARAAKVSRPTVYAYFKNKYDVFTAVGVLRAELVNEFINIKLLGIGNTLHKIEEAIIASVIFCIEDKSSRRIFESGAPHILFKVASDKGLPLPARDRWRALLAEGVANGLVRKDINVDLCVNWIVESQIVLISRVLWLGETVDILRYYIKLFVIEGIMVRVN